MNTELSPPDPLSSLSPELRAVFERAREAYRAGDHERALALNQELCDRASAEANSLGRVLGQRFMGLCLYRLGKLDRSAEQLRAARALAEQAKDHAQYLLICNHLASTLRRQGKLDEAFQLLTEALDQAPLPRCLHAHTRLVGNLGALYDELGQRSHADDCYARFEVLAEVLENPHWLANARGLAARAAELRRDLDTAEKKYRQERELARKSRDPLRSIAATIHTARMAAHRKKLDEAEELFREALEQTKKCSYEKRRIDALESYADFLFKEKGELSRAYFYLEQAAALAKREPEKKALVAHKTALVCREAGLLGESLFHLMHSVEIRHELYTKLKHAHVRGMADTRLAELREITDKLVEEALRVGRSGAETKDLEKLVVRVHGKDLWKEFERKLRALPGPPVWNWQKQAKEAARATWLKRLPKPVLEALDKDTQQALVRAELSYGGAIDDLSRSAQLMALAVECEMRERIFHPARHRFKTSAARNPASKTHQYFVENEKWTLGKMVESLQEVAAPDAAPSERDLLVPFRKLLATSKPLVERLVRLGEKIVPVKGTARRLLDVRNDIAHNLTTDLSRLEVDAITRTLTLEIPAEGKPSLLAALAQIKL